MNRWEEGKLSQREWETYNAAARPLQDLAGDSEAVQEVAVGRRITYMAGMRPLGSQLEEEKACARSTTTAATVEPAVASAAAGATATATAEQLGAEGDRSGGTPPVGLQAGGWKRKARAERHGAGIYGIKGSIPHKEQSFNEQRARRRSTLRWHITGPHLGRFSSYRRSSAQGLYQVVRDPPGGITMDP